ncbi:hypothetical protein HY745_12360 [Candidatus Desantisbacteria bacterium]|nr:hypothetical protein [Candidatus Desantisbacteria bacterium]
MNIVWKAVGYLAAMLTMFGFVPQILKMLKTKSAGDLSMGALIQISIGVCLWLLYGIHINDVIIIFANSITLLSLVITLYLYFRFSKKTTENKNIPPVL